MLYVERILERRYLALRTSLILPLHGLHSKLEIGDVNADFAFSRHLTLDRP